MSSVSVFRLDAEFDAFLFAPIGEDRNGLLLSVVSALARLNLDPWIEAARLAQLPVRAASERLAGLIATLPEEALVRPDPERIADRLIGLLPRRGVISVPATLSVSAMVSSKAHVIVICAAILVGIVIAQWLSFDLEARSPIIGSAAPSARSASP